MILRRSILRLARGAAMLLTACLAVPFPVGADGPTGTEPETGIRSRQAQPIALTGGRIVTEPGRVLESATVLIDGGVITAVGAEVTIPSHARTIEMSGKTIYPALIDAYSDKRLNTARSKSAHWNREVRPERNVVDTWEQSSETHEAHRKAGFGLRLVAPRQGVLKGTSAVVTTGDRATPSSVVISKAAHHVRLTSRPGASRDEYPRSPMGAVAIARQTCYDAQWYREAWRAYQRDASVARPDTNLALRTLSHAIEQDELFVLDAPDEQYALRADRFAREFGLRIAIRGSGREYQRLEAIAACQRPVIVPLNFPKPPNVATVEAPRDATLSELMHWRLAPENPRRLVEAGVTVAFTAHGLDKPTSFREKLRQAVERGLDPDAALYGCTVAPATLLGIADKAGTIEVGKAAHFMITDGDWLAKESHIVETWVDGKRFEAEPDSEDRLTGLWELKVNAKPKQRRRLYLQISAQGKKLKGVVSLNQPTPNNDSSRDTTNEDHSEASPTANAGQGKPTEFEMKSLATSYGRLTAAFSADIWDVQGTVRMSAAAVGEASDQLVGNFLDETGKQVSFVGHRHEAPGGEEQAPESQDGEESPPSPSDPAPPKATSQAARESEPVEINVNFPLGAHGADSTNRAPSLVLFENATVWTCNEAGQLLETASVLCDGGKIIAVGLDLDVPQGAQRINARGKHLTPGIIDCHSHMATDGGVNEGTQAITSEVRIGDFVDATDINIYRQLAGGVTCVNILHGSANPIGGQNQVIKLRWGKLPEELKFAGAPPGIKFALGENVKQSNWGDEYTTRYPQTRMGVEQIMRDAFLAAKEYERQRNHWQQHRRGIPPRRDLELDAILEIVNGKRWIHCHSYRQDEILALMRTLESFQIRIGTFQHILEGYKVAPEMAAHGAMGSAFSDWWTYKFEVRDAIPYNGALMHEAGIVVSFNSDDRELARHLNHEAAKAVKYGGVDPIDALKFVTLNPAKQLRIEQHVGSIEVGKDADLVLWSGPPLSILSRCEQTWVDGVRYFDREADIAQRSQQTTLREQLVRMILDSGEPMKAPGERENLLRDFWPRFDEYCGHGHAHDHGGH